MWRARPILPQRMKRVLFGSPDRVLSTISVIEGFISVVFSVFVYKYPEPPPEYVITRDLLLVLLLILIIVVLSLKYYKKDELVQHFRSLLSHQLVSTHQLIDKFRDHFFCDIRYPLLHRENLSQEIDQIRKHYFNQVCHSVLIDTRKLFQDYFRARGLNVEEDLTVTVKLIITRDEAQEILDQFKGDQADTLSPRGKYIVTAFRDPYTWEEKPERKEVKQIVYRVEENTAFDDVINGGKDKFCSNNLKELYEKNAYTNQHQGWQNLYNSSLVVPIRYRPSSESSNILYYGVLAIDSKNPRGHDLFDDEITFNMLAHAADTLAIMLGHIDILQRFLIKGERISSPSSS
jgi:hypothetical protein